MLIEWQCVLIKPAFPYRIITMLFTQPVLNFINTSQIFFFFHPTSKKISFYWLEGGWTRFVFLFVNLFSSRNLFSLQKNYIRDNRFMANVFHKGVDIKIQGNILIVFTHVAFSELITFIGTFYFKNIKF